MMADMGMVADNNGNGPNNGAGEGGLSKSTSSVALCASCDRCRARKTKCDGKRPCGNCAAKYMKKHKLTSIEGIDLALFECVYSPAKRRGPIPRGASSRVMNKSDLGLAPQGEQPSANAEWPSMQQQPNMMDMNNMNPMFASVVNQQQQQQQQQQFGNADNIQQQINMLQQLQQQQQQLQQQQMNGQQQQQQMNGNDGTKRDLGMGNFMNGEPMARRMKREDNGTNNNGIPRTLAEHTHLLEPSDPDGARLFAYYKLSIDELYRLPPTPTDEEYCNTKLAPYMPGVTPQMIPGSHLAALSAARFAEIALGALVHNEVALGLELCNAVVHCLRESVQEAVQPPAMYIVAKAYFLLGVFRACRGDMARYFKYRRVCMTYLTKMENSTDTNLMLASVSYLDSWAYMIYNADEKALPINVEDNFNNNNNNNMRPAPANATELKYDVKIDAPSIAADPRNQNWIQGAPPVYLNNEAPLNARSLDALACAVRTCCDQANTRFDSLAREAGRQDQVLHHDVLNTPTTTAVLSHENELCSRNMILSAYTLMQQHENASKNKHMNEGQHLVISAMDAFLENSDEDGSAGFTDSQIQSLLAVCNTSVENPNLLHHAGPTYHMVTNAAVLLCHLLNGMHAMKGQGNFGAMEATMFEEVLDTFISVRKLLTIHRRKLPVKLRCHGIPRPSIDGPQQGQPFIDLGETLLCVCRGCQGFVLMACSPCVAAERARDAEQRLQLESAQEAEAAELGELDRELDIMGEEFNLDDDALLNVISSMITN